MRRGNGRFRPLRPGPPTVRRKGQEENGGEIRDGRELRVLDRSRCLLPVRFDDSNFDAGGRGGERDC